MSQAETRPIRMHDETRHTLDRDRDVFWCGECGARWCDVCLPTPSARCPFEYEHGLPHVHRGALALYRALHGPVKVRITEVVSTSMHTEVKCLVTTRLDRVYSRGDVIWTSPVWLTSRRGEPYCAAR